MDQVAKGILESERKCLKLEDRVKELNKTSGGDETEVVETDGKQLI